MPDANHIGLNKLTRRDFLRLCGTSSIGLALAACGVTPTPIPTLVPMNTSAPTNTPTPTSTATVTVTPTASATATDTVQPTETRRPSATATKEVLRAVTLATFMGDKPIEICPGQVIDPGRITMEQSSAFARAALENRAYNDYADVVVPADIAEYCRVGIKFVDRGHGTHVFPIRHIRITKIDSSNWWPATDGRVGTFFWGVVLETNAKVGVGMMQGEGVICTNIPGQLAFIDTGNRIDTFERARALVGLTIGVIGYSGSGNITFDPAWGYKIAMYSSSPNS